MIPIIKDDQEFLEIIEQYKKDNEIFNLFDINYEYYKEFMQKIDRYDYKSIVNVSNSCIFNIIAQIQLMRDSDMFDCEEIYSLLAKKSKIADEWTADDIFTLYTMAEYYSDIYIIKENKQEEKEAKKIKDIELKLAEGLKKLDLEEFKDLEDFPPAVLAISGMLAFKEALKKKNEFLKKIDANSLPSLEKVSKKNRGLLNNDEDIQIIFDTMIDYMDANKKQKNTNDAFLENQIKCYDYLKSFITSKESQEKTKLDPKLSKVVEANLLNYVIKKINENVIKKYEETQLLNNELKEKISSNKIEEYLLSLKINSKQFKGIRRDTINQIGDINIMKEIFSLYQSFNISPIEILNGNLFYVLIDTDISIIAEIRKNLNNGIITPDFILENPGILLNKVAKNNPIKPLFKQMIDNITLLKQNDYSFKTNYHPSIILQNTDNLITNINLLKHYKLDDYCKNYLVSHIDKIDCLDLMIEKDIPLYLIKLIAESYDYKILIKKILILNTIETPYIKENGLLIDSLLVPNAFAVDDSQIDDHIIDDVEKQNIISKEIKKKTLKSDIVLGLDYNYMLDNNVYNINGIKISRNKFLRILSTNKEINDEFIISSLTYNSILSSYEIDTIKNEVLKLHK